ncbi:MAG: hypothetical protein LBM70_09155 [Victivallales bacterium]|jgi:hypothetical protein|nr:hypothetical protein [Victivallales bacterium]
MRKKLIILLILSILCTPLFTPETEAMDPVTIAILTPIAIKGAQIAAPYVMRGLMSGGRHMASMGYDLVNFFRLPLGVIQSTLGIPLGQFTNGLRNAVAGSSAMFKFIVKALILPIEFFRIGG